MFGLALNPWALVAAGLLAVGIFFGGYGCHAVKAAQEKGEMAATIKTDEALLDEIKSQRADFIKQRDAAQLAAAKVPTVVTNWMKDTNAIQILPGCDGAVDFTYKRVPVLVGHRQEATP